MSGMLVRPSPLPEELDRGYLGQLMRVNGYRAEKEFVEAMAAHFGMPSKTRRELPLARLLAMMADQTTESFIRGHTTQPLRRSITSYHPEVRHGSLERASLLFTSGTTAARVGFYFCPECAKEDVSFHGVSYWRRDIQIPGQFWCQRHSTALRYVLDGTGFIQTPLSHLDTAERVPRSLANAAAKNAFVNRYLEVAAGLAERMQPLDVRSVSSTLKTQAGRLGLRTHGGASSNPLLSDRIVKSFPRDWLATVRPELLNKPVGQSLNIVDGVLYLAKSASAVWSYILAAAVLYPSADDALNALISQAGIQRGQKPRVRRSPAAVPDDERVMRAYVRSLGSHAKASNELDLPRQVVATRLKKLGLPALSGAAKPGRLQALSALLLDGRSLAESAQLGNITECELLSLLTESCPNLVSALREISNSEGLPERHGRRTRAMTPREAEAVGLADGMVDIPLRVDTALASAADNAKPSTRRNRVAQ